MTKPKIEKTWKYRGYVCEVIGTYMGHRCGYVGVPEGHFTNEWSDEDLYVINVHGGVTFHGKRNVTEYKDLNWIGFDCGHYRDGKDVSLMDEYNVKMYEKNRDLYEGEVRTLEFCVRECESMVDQLLLLTPKTLSHQEEMELQDAIHKLLQPYGLGDDYRLNMTIEELIKKKARQ